ncbi:MAG: NUDIX domain-containing protein [Steroidobacteraceae bacterium]
MPKKRSAGILLYRRRSGMLEVFLVHPGGPFWAQKDDAAWSVPKGEYQADEAPLDAARREFREETGFPADGHFIALPEIMQPSGKRVLVWALEGDLDTQQLRSNVFELEWPPHSGQRQEFPEVDRGAWFALDAARRKLLPSQVALLDALAKMIAAPLP